MRRAFLTILLACFALAVQAADSIEFWNTPQQQANVFDVPRHPGSLPVREAAIVGERHRQTGARRAEHRLQRDHADAHVATTHQHVHFRVGCNCRGGPHWARGLHGLNR